MLVVAASRPRLAVGGGARTTVFLRARPPRPHLHLHEQQQQQQLQHQQQPGLHSQQRRGLATKPQKKPEVKKVTAAELRAKEKKKMDNNKWGVKTVEKDRNLEVFSKLMHTEDLRARSLKEVSRSERSLWEKEVAHRFQVETNREYSRYCFEFECKSRIRDCAIRALKDEDLIDEAMQGSQGLPYFPLNRKIPAWTPRQRIWNPSVAEEEKRVKEEEERAKLLARRELRKAKAAAAAAASRDEDDS